MLTNSTSPPGVFIERAQNNWREKQAGDTMAGKNLAGEKIAGKKAGKNIGSPGRKRAGEKMAGEEEREENGGRVWLETDKITNICGLSIKYGLLCVIIGWVPFCTIFVVLASQKMSFLTNEKQKTILR